MAAHRRAASAFPEYGDPARETETHALLRETVAPPRTGGLKALLEQAPLEGIDLVRPRELDRDPSL